MRGARGEFAEEAIVDLFVEEEAGGGGTHLALVAEDAPEGGAHGGVEIGVGEDDVGRLAAQFQAQALEIGDGGILQELARGGDAAGEADLVDVLVKGERFAGGGAVAGDDGERAFREAGLAADFGEAERVERGQLGGLEDHRTAAGKGGRDLPGGGLQREIPGHDGRDHAHRFAEGVVEVRAIHRDGLAVQFADPAGVIVEAIGCGGDVGAGGLAEGLAGLLGDELGEFVAVL